MVEIVINYDPKEDKFRVYEPTTDTILVSQNITESLVNLSKFLSSKNLIEGDILSYPDISYHIDSETMKRIIESNVNLIKRLKTAPSGFTLSSQRFGSSVINNTNNFQTKSNKNFDSSQQNKKKYKFSNNNFTGNNGFSSAMKKFGSKY